MTERKIPRRQVFAFIALNTDEASAPHEVEIREYEHDGRDWHVVDLKVDSEAAVRFWARVFGHDERHLRRSEHVRKDGSRWTGYYSQDTGWRGFTTEVAATVDEPVADAPLDEQTIEQLRAVAAEDGTR